MGETTFQHVVVVDAAVVEDDIVFTLAELCRASGARAEQVHALVAEGVLAPAGGTPQAWVFAGASLSTARAALRLARELALDLPAAALVLQLRQEIDSLRARLRHAGLD